MKPALRPHLAQLPSLSGLLVAVLGATALSGWLQWPGLLVVLHGTLPALQFNTALAFLAAGGALIAASHHAHRLKAGLGWLVALLSGITLGEPLANLDLDLNRRVLQAISQQGAELAGRMAPATAIAFLLAAAALLLQSRSPAARKREFCAGLLGAGEVAVGAVALFHYIFGIATPLTAMAPPTAVGHVVLGLGVTSQVFLRPANSPGEILRRRGSLVVIALLTVTVMLWHGLQRFSEAQLVRHLQAEIHGLGGHVEAQLRERAILVEHLAHRWEAGGGTPRAAWTQEVDAYLANTPSLLSLQWVDPAGRVRWVEPLAGNEAAVGLDNSRDPVRSQLLERARGQGESVFSGELALRQGGRGLLLVRALRVKNRLDGYLVAVFRTADLFSDLTRSISARDFEMQIALDGQILYQHGGARPPAAAHAQTFRFTRGGSWQVTIRPTRSATAHTALPELLLVSGVAQALLAGLVFWFWGQSQQRAQAAREADRAVRHERNFVASLLDNTTALCIVLDREGRIVRLNQAYQALSGARLEDLRGQPYWEHLLGENETPDSARQAFARLIAAPRPTQSEKVWRDKDGRPHVIAWSATVMSDPRGRPEHVCAIGVDITARKEAERALMAAKNEAETANRAKSLFLSSMSHELRTPMNAVLGFAQLMDMDDSLPAAHRESVEQILRAGAHLLKLINDVLSLAKIEAGNIDLSLEPVECGRLIQDCLAMVRPLAEQRGIRIELPATPPVVLQADRRLLKQILLNLLSNAIKYNRPDGWVRIEALATADGGGVLRVTDAGDGIPAARLPELFQPFNRLGAEASGIEGSGIGLAVSRQLVDAMGGDISVLSQAGTGTQFQVTLPGRTAAAESLRNPTPRAPVSAP